MKVMLTLEVCMFLLCLDANSDFDATQQSRLTTVNDVPSIGPFFFVEPDLSSEEARSMTKSLSPSDRRKHCSSDYL
jgi:hypothetical protein